MPRKRLDLPQRSCVSCKKRFKPRRQSQRFCCEVHAQAWYHKQRKAILHESGLVEPKPHVNIKPWGWKRMNGVDVYIPKGDLAAIRKYQEQIPEGL